MKARSFPVFTALVLTLAACSSPASPSPTATGTAAPGFDQAIRDVQNASDASGGTLRVLVPKACDLADPSAVEMTDPSCANLLRTTTRQLMAYASLPGRFGSVAVPDLAEAPGQTPDGGMTWTYRLRDDAVWSDGSVVTASDAIVGLRALDVARDDVEIADVAADGQTLTVVLVKSQPALNQLLALPVASPRRGELTSGPFLVQQAADEASPLVLTRNDAWVPTSDPIRAPKVDRIEVSVIRPATEALGVIEAGVADVSLVTAVDPVVAERLLADPAVASSIDNPGTGATVYLSMSGSGAWRQAECRQGIFSAVDRTAVVDELGGNALARIATTMSPPTIASFEPSYRPFSIGDGTGDLGVAGAALSNCGRVLTLGYGRELSGVASSIKDALQRVGIDVMLTETTVGNVDAMLVRDFQEVPGVWGFWQPLTSSLNMPSIDVLLRSPEITSSDADVQADVGRVIDRLVIDSAMFIPLAYVTTVSYRPSTLTNVATSGAFANQYDVVNLGVGAAQS